MTIYVGNLAFSTTEEELAGAFANYGDVQSVKIVKDHETGRSKGFGFVEMTNDTAGDKAISAMNGAKLRGRELKVNRAFHKKDMQ
jgi:RNA recognition motif-containing protein